MYAGERFNSITHLIGSVLAVIGTSVAGTLAILGVAKDVFLRGRYRALSVVLYLLMGWLVVAAFAPLQRALPSPGIMLLAAGGMVYTVGVVFFALSKKVVHMHGVWHLFVLGGSICHYLAVVRYVAVR